MKVIFYSLVLLMVPFYGNAQDEVVRVHGRIISKETAEALVYATIMIKNSPAGTVANTSGQFEIVIRNPKTTDSLVVSMLGYESKSFSLSSINKEGEFIIELAEKAFQLEEVIVRDKELSGEDYLTAALKKHKDNQPANPYVLSIFFRETAKLDDKYFSLLEAAGSLEGKKQNRGSLEVNIEEIRIGLGKPPDVPVVGEKYNPFTELDASIIFNKRVSPCQTCKYEIEEYSTFQNHSIVVVSSYKKPDRKSEGYMKFYIDLEDYGIWRFEFETTIPFGVGFPEVLENGINSSLVFLSRRIDYQKVGEKYYLHQYHQAAKHRYEQSGKKAYSTEHFFSLIVNDIRNSEVKNLASESKMDYRHSLSKHLKNYNPEFWKSYNIIKQSPLDKKVISDLRNGSGKEDIFE